MVQEGGAGGHVQSKMTKSADFWVVVVLGVVANLDDHVQAKLTIDV